MIRNYIKIALRNFSKNRAYSLINVIGLSCGVTCCLLIALFIRHELSYDRFQEKGDRIVRTIMEYSIGGNVNRGNYTSTKVGPSFKRNFPEVENFVRMFGTKRIVRYEEKTFVENRFVYTDSTFFDLFSFRLLAGHPKKALAGPNHVVLSQSAAKKYFGNDNPVGKTIKVSSDAVDYIVTGVIEDCPKNSQIKYDFLAPFSSLGVIQEKTYHDANYTTYLLLRDKDCRAYLQEKIGSFMKKEMAGEVVGDDYIRYILEPFFDVHLYSEHPGFEVNGSIMYLYIVGAVAILILSIACFTFVNLCTARSVERAKEIGIRKTAGAFKNQIFWQFIVESVIITFLSTLLSFFTAAVLLPQFNGLMGRELDIHDLVSIEFVSGALIMVILVGFLAGCYPALVISAVQPVRVLKGIFRNSGQGLQVRRGLFVLQFVISVFLVICAVVIHEQLAFFQNKKLGFDKEHLIVLPMDSKVQLNYSTLKSELKKDPAVRYVAQCDFEPHSIYGGYSMRKPGMPEGSAFAVFAGGIDEEYVRACGIELAAGSDITERDVKEATADSLRYYHFIINESAATQMGWTPKEAIGKKMSLGDGRPGEVKGVARDFHFSSLHNPIKPLVLFPNSYINRILVKVSGADMKQTISAMEQSWRELEPHRPFTYSFVDENYKLLYDAEARLGKAVGLFTLLAAFLAALGLFGLSAFSILQRTKEIGIRKVLGATLGSIISLLSKDYVRLILIAILIASSMAWYAMNAWLGNFAYRIHLSVWMFVLAGISAIALAVVTISFHVVKAGLNNPVKNLRTE